MSLRLSRRTQDTTFCRCVYHAARKVRRRLALAAHYRELRDVKSSAPLASFTSTRAVARRARSVACIFVQSRSSRRVTCGLHRCTGPLVPWCSYDWL